MITEFLVARYPQLTFHFIDNTDYANTNNIYSLWLARPFVDGKDFILLDSDILYDGRIIGQVLSEKASILTVSKHPLGEEEMKVVVDEKGSIVEISKTCDPGPLRWVSRLALRKSTRTTLRPYTAYSIR